MKLVYRQLAGDLLKNRVFVALLFVMAACTAVFYFDFHFAIDKNLAGLQALAALSENQQHYHTALQSNLILARAFLLVMVGVCAFAFAIFFYRYFRSNRRQMGCLKSLGFRDRAIAGFFVLFAVALAIPAALLGLAVAWFTTEAFLSANMQSYGVSGLVKGIHLQTFLIGVLTPAAVFGATAFLCYGAVRGKETGSLLAGADTSRTSVFLPVAARIAQAVPVKNKFPLRIALRRPLALLIVFGAVLTFLVFFVMATSLLPSSQVVYDTQTVGHHYRYQAAYPEPRQAADDEGALHALRLEGQIALAGKDGIDVSVIGAEWAPDLFAPQDKAGNPLPEPAAGQLYLNPGLVEMYGLGAGDTVRISAGGKERDFAVTGVMFNALAGGVYLNRHELLEWQGLPGGAYNYTQSMQPPAGGEVITPAEKEETLLRGFVSNNNSSTLNHVVGFVAGTVLIFLGLLLSFQDSARDILILHLMGYRPRDINRLLLDVYRPLIWLLFALSAGPAVAITKAVLRALSVQTNDYMPFTTSPWVFVAAFVVVNLIYHFVQTLFRAGVRRVIRREEVAAVTAAE